MDLKRIIISSLLIASVTSATSCNSDFFAKKSKSSQESTPAKQMVYAPELDPDVHELITDQRFKSLENEEPLRFETTVTPDEAASDTPVELLDDSGKTISKMYDDGTHSDRIAGDGIYTCSYQPKPDGETSFSYTAKIGDTETEPASVRYFDKITEQDVEDMQDVGKKFTEIQSKYLDSEGYVPDDKKEEALEEIGEYAKSLYNNGDAVEYRVNKDYDNIIIKLSSGISCVYSNSNNIGTKNNVSAKSLPPSVPSTTSSSSTVTFSPHPIDVKIYQPFLSTDFDNPVDEQAANYACNEFPGMCRKKEVVTDDNVTPNAVSTFGPDQLIIWDGHGNYDPIIHSYLLTHYPFNPDDYEEADIVEDRVLVQFHRQSYFNETGKWYDLTQFYTSISSEYIDAHCPDMTNSFVYLGACYSTTDSVLSASFIKKNCNVIFGYSDEVDYPYEQNVLEALLKYMSEPTISNVTGNARSYPTINEALIYAKSQYGENDGAPTPAEPMIFGNRDYRFADAIRNELEPPINYKDKIGNGTLTLEKYYYKIKVGESVEVKTISTPSDAGTLKWAINDSSVATIYDWDENDTLQTGEPKLMETGTITGISPGVTMGHVVSEDGTYSQSFCVYVYK